MSALMATDGQQQQQQQQQLQLSPICTEIRKKEVEALVSTYKIACNRKKRRMLMEMSSSSFKSYEIGIIVADCCRVIYYALHSTLYNVYTKYVPPFLY